MAATNSKVLGTVTSVVGEVKATASDGTTRILQVGDKVFSDEVISTSPTGDVKIALEGSGRTLECGNDSNVALSSALLGIGAAIAGQDASPVIPPSVAATQEVAAPAGKPPAGPTDVSALQAAIAAGADPSQVAEATAAGAPGAGGPDGGGGHQPVVIDQGNTTTPVTSGFNTRGGSIDFPNPQINELPPLEGAPVVSVSVQVEVEVEDPENPGSPGDGVVVSGNAASLIEGTNVEAGGKLVNFIITLDKPFDTEVQVTYTIVPGTAETPSDFFDGPLTQTITIPAGETEIIIPVIIVEDHFVENNETFSIVLVDAVNATINPTANTAVVTIVDDDALPVANADTNWVREDAFVGEGDAPMASGNVLLTQSHAGDPSDVLSFADAADTDFEPLTVTTTGTFNGTYGTLILNGDGSYTYTLNNAAAAVQALDDGETLTDAFQYSVTDGFNTPSSSTVTITIFGSNDGPEITVRTGEGPFTTSAQGTVLEEALLIGSNPESAGEFVAGSFRVSDPNGLDDIESVTINGQTVAIGDLIGADFDGDHGVLTVTSFAEGIANFTYELLEAVTDDAGVETDVFTLTTSDGDSVSAPATITINIIDDVPSIDVTATGSADALAVDESDLSVNASANFADNFGVTSGFGADGAGSISTSYTLGVSASGVDSGVDDVATGQNVLLFLEGGQVVGRVGGSEGAVVFTVSVNGSGTVTLDQQRAVEHPDTADADDTVSLSAANLITLTRSSTITDADGDSDTDSAVIDIGTALSFDDDGPSIDVTSSGEADALAVDESDLSVNASANFADNFGVTSGFGADGAGSISTSYTLGVSASGVDSGVDDVATGQNVLLFLEGGQVVGRVGGSEGAVVFTVSVNGSGTVTLDQQRAVEHPDTADADDTVSLSAANLITLTRSSTITDADGDSDTDSAVIDIGTALSFDDDGPSIDITAGSTTVVEGQTINNGAWTSDPGADGGVVKVRFNGADYDLDQAIDTGKGTLTVNANGTWTFAAANNLDQDVAQNVSFDLRMTDADGDFASDSHTISITDGAGPAASAPQSMVVEEAALSDGTNPSSPDEADTALLTFTSGSDAITSITFGSTAGINVAGLDESQTITWVVSNGGRTLTGSINGDAVIRVELSGASTVAAGGAAGNVTATATLLNSMLHQNSPDADSLTITGVQVVAADPDGSTATFTFTGITVNDDAPTVTAPSGTIENDVGESLAGLVDYDMNADGLGAVTLNAPTVTSGGQAHILKSNGHTIVYQITDDGDDGLQELKAYADNDNNGFDAGDTLVFTLAPAAPDAVDGSYTLTMNDVVDLPVPIISLAFTNIFSPNQVDDRVAIQDSADGPSSLLISAVNSGDKVTDSASFVGIHNNVMNAAETIRYEFGTVDLTSGDATFMTVTDKKLVNDVQLFSFDTGGSPDSFSWVAYRDGSEVGSGSVSPTTLPQGNSGALFPAIHVDGGYDTVVFTVSQGSEFKVGGVTYTELGAPQDVNLNVAFGGSDADGDTIGGSFNVTITGGDGTAESNIIQTLLNNNQPV